MAWLALTQPKSHKKLMNEWATKVLKLICYQSTQDEVLFDNRNGQMRSYLQIKTSLNLGRLTIRRTDS